VAEENPLTPAATEAAVVAPESEQSATGSNGLARALQELLVAIPPLLVVAVVLFWSDQNGGYEPVLWYPGALILLGLLVVVGSDRRFRSELRSRRAVALAAITAYAAWSALSILWAQARADAWDGANRTLLYATVFAILACWPTGTRVKAVVTAIYAVGVAVLGLVTLQQGVHHPGSLLVGSRLAMPVGYTNGTAALFLIPLWPALYLAARREVPALARGLLLATAGALLELAVLVQSRGSAIAFPIVLVLFVALTPARARVLLSAGAILAVGAANLPTLLNVYHASANGKPVAPALADARDRILLSILVLFVVGSAAALLDRRSRVSPGRARRLEWGIVTLFALATIGGATGSALAVGHPLGRLDSAWHDFKTGNGSYNSSSHFISTGGTNRWDFWRVAMSQVGKHPALGIGADNFAVDYVRERRSNEEPLYPHSLEVRILLGTGIVGAALFTVFLGFGLAAGLRGRSPSFARGLAAACVAGFAYWFVHGSADWFWELPALTSGALLMLGLAAAPDAAKLRPRAGIGGMAAGTLFVGLSGLVAASFVFPWLSARKVDLATHDWRSDPAAAYRLLADARRLNPLSDNPDLVAGAIAQRRGENEQARIEFRQALERDSADWYANLELGVLEAMRGRRAAALAYLRRAHELDPREWQITDAAKRIRAGQPVHSQEMNRAFLRRALVYETRAH
jgi:tetratricopeptide (TPR) repeat protein